MMVHLSDEEKRVAAKLDVALRGEDAKIVINVLRIRQQRLENKHNLNNGLKQIELLMLGGNKS